MMVWRKAMVVMKAVSGERTIIWRADGCDNKIESRKRFIPHSARSGGWFHTTYFVVKPDGTEKEYARMMDAKEVAESGY